MPAAARHRTVPVIVQRVPPPFHSLAMRSEEPRHEVDARSPYGWVHLLRTPFLDAAQLARLAAQARVRVIPEPFPDIAHARTTLEQLLAVPQMPTDLADQLAASLQLTGVLGSARAAYRDSLDTRIDYLGSCGAGFHNDVSHHWPACLFWLLALAVEDVEFVMPHAAVRLPLVPGDLLVFDPTMAHGLCRPGDAGEAVAESFDPRVPGHHQHFLTGELLLSDAQWAALGVPWQGIEVHAQGGALDLMVAEFDVRSGAVKRLRDMQACMRRGGD